MKQVKGGYKILIAIMVIFVVCLSGIGLAFQAKMNGDDAAESSSLASQESASMSVSTNKIETPAFLSDLLQKEYAALW
ncbi:hypothetical protein [Aerococcus agrisoli]|uniref:hypothetical protein n=1 Tax=Aerococcus agrisoli TaxID=2487350 RepID=UPI001F204802|nr:hypothetical protein [Aerococcus agrisoli]